MEGIDIGIASHPLVLSVSLLLSPGWSVELCFLLASRISCGPLKLGVRKEE